MSCFHKGSGFRIESSGFRVQGLGFGHMREFMITRDRTYRPPSGRIPLYKDYLQLRKAPMSGVPDSKSGRCLSDITKLSCHRHQSDQSWEISGKQPKTPNLQTLRLGEKVELEVAHSLAAAAQHTSLRPDLQGLLVEKKPLLGPFRVAGTGEQRTVTSIPGPYPKPETLHPTP